MVRKAVLNGYTELMFRWGHDPSALMRSVGIDPAMTGGEGWLSAEAVNTLFELSAATTGHEDFGMQLATARGLSNLGPVALAAREEPDVRGVMTMMLRHINVHNEGLVTRLIEGDGRATVQIGPPAGFVLGPQSIELTIAATTRILREFLHDDWQPLTVCFTHQPPSDLGTHHQIFGANVRFGSSFNGIVFYSHALDRRNETSDPLLRPLVSQYLQSLLPQESATTADRTRSMIESLLPTGRCSAAHIARSFGMDRRTLHRHLTEENANYRSLVDEVRMSQAQYYLANKNRTMTEISQDLGFASLSTFSRWFHSKFGCSARSWSSQRVATSEARTRGESPT
ncbi:AraC family transcriptional regulator [Gordonia sp. (in: high G+C Gram-positive bacteria)]|uniref:AraC family transcriptional regulator n=1 Tax=Gordonia sp. (in: high G+C Gram-positive bacteria) TaxID=84139 RepID=UPI0016B952F2|nr:AraC family transcriptional regulator [Gordonia sp. (in: high G+C Gram-positive bacteria)]NLG47665.1 AraC family transcriptional regulator [Gordonia sp. (in: high G+C Gram-positive bacteria)]